MKKLLTIATLILTGFVGLATAQTNKDEQEILKIHNELDQAFLKKDAATFERVFADDLVVSDAYGKMKTRAETLDEMRKDWADTNRKFLGAKSDNLKVRVSGSTAFVTGNWTSTAAPANDANAEPHQDTGRYTGIYEKRGGKWLLVAEHWSEAAHDKKAMEAQILKMGQSYGEMIGRGDAAAIERILADEYLYTNEKGAVINKTEDLARIKSGKTKFSLAVTSDQKVRVVGDDAAVETGTFRAKGTTDGKPFDTTERYTAVWVWRDLRWQLVSDHTSTVLK